MTVNYENNTKKIKYADRKIIWRMIYDDESVKEYESVTDFLSHIEEVSVGDKNKFYNNLKTLVEDSVSFVETNTILNNLRDEMISINDSKNLGLDLGFVKRYQKYGMHRDQKKLVVKINV